MKAKAFDLIKKYKYAVIAGVALLLVLVIVIAIAASSSDRSHKSEKWGEGITEGIPQFDGSNEEIESGEGYVAAYYKNVSGDDIAEYVSELKSACGISFDGDKYPRTAIYGDRIITLHYNVTEMKFSVTVTNINQAIGETP